MKRTLQPTRIIGKQYAMPFDPVSLLKFSKLDQPHDSALHNVLHKFNESELTSMSFLYVYVRGDF